MATTELDQEMRLPLVANVVFNEPWAIKPEVFAIVCEVVRGRMKGSVRDERDWKVSADAYTVRATAHGNRARSNGTVAVLPLFGLLGQRMNLMMAMSGGTSTEGFGRAFQEAVRDESIGSIVIDVDSPVDPSMEWPSCGKSSSTPAVPSRWWPSLTAWPPALPTI